MALRSDRARRRAIKQRNMRILVIILVLIALVLAAIIIYTQFVPEGTSKLMPFFTAYLGELSGSPIFS